VTHDQEEALSISDRVVVMNGGVAEQVGAPFEVYNQPATRFVASFVGTLNLIEAQVTDAATGAVRIGGQAVALGRALPARDRVTLALRPEVVTMAPMPGRHVALPGRIASVSFLGSVIRIRAEVGEASIAFDTFNTPDAPPPSPGDAVSLGVAPRDLMALTD
jgi:putative spermidine/putrescine transport system ATP-binding protein